MSPLLSLVVTGALEYVVLVLVATLTAAVPVLVIFWFARMLLTNSRENTRLRLEVSKLADELERVRKQQGK